MISCSIAGVRLGEVLRDTMIMLMPMFGVLMLVIMWPQVTLFIPSLISPDFLK
jgi:TRAP-type C4-dicarboxylate transport system permease large subunit